jgi:hypothetical protein
MDTLTPPERLPRKVPARAGFAWVNTSFRLFFKSPLLLAAGFGLFFGAMLAASLVPWVGSVVSELLSPIFMAGFMRVYRRLDDSEEPELPDFLIGFRHHLLPLAMVGAVYLATLSLVLLGLQAMGIDFAAIQAAIGKGASMDEVAALMEGKQTALLLGMAIILPVVLATWFAPALILFGGAPPLLAMGLSLQAGVRNWAAMLLNSLALFAVMLLGALIPFVGLLIAGPILIANAYLGYQAMFALPTTGQPGEPS